MRVVMMAVM